MIRPAKAAARARLQPRVLQVSAEVFPLVKTGGLADVAGALPAALGHAGADVRLLLPGLPAIRAALAGQRRVGTVVPPWGGEPAALLLGALPMLGASAYVIDQPALYDRPGNPYQDAHHRAYDDNHRRFALLGQVAALLAEGFDGAWMPNIVHGHDWHAGLAPAYLAYARDAGRIQARSVFTVHNLAYQGLFPIDKFVDLGLPPQAFSVQGAEFHGQVSFMKAGLHYADRITTVSPTYAREIQHGEFGCGLDGVLRQRSAVVSGILNGVDPGVWHPATDAALAANYDAGRLAGKARCKAALQVECGLDAGCDAPLFAVVSRLTEQKGLHLVLAALPALLQQGGQLVVLGSGDSALEQGFVQAVATHPGRVALRRGQDEALAHRIFAGSDVTLVPSRFEPCGLTQLYGLAYGSLPLVRRTGGLADTVVDCTLEDIADGTATGFVFDSFDLPGLQRALRRAFTLWQRPRDWRTVRKTAMVQDFGWERSAQDYLALYRSLLAA